ncbi:O-antigen ligase family protein [Akkermansiaceae bacterium]|nr:O-antigen ligase family protein [Akkermansiaceae bacterium]
MNIQSSRKLSFIVLGSLICTSGSILNLLDIDEYLIFGLFILLLFFAIKEEIFSNINNITALFWLFFGVVVLLFFQAIIEKNSGNIFNKNNISFILMSTSCGLACMIFTARANFVSDLNLILKFVTMHGVLTLLVLAIFPSQTILLNLPDGSACYQGHFYIFLQRVNLNYLGDLVPIFVEIGDFRFRRIHGIAWEPGNYAAYVNLLLFINLFLRKNAKWTVISAMAIILSWSTAGLISLIFQLLMAFYVNRRTIVRRLGFIKICIVIGCAVSICFLFYINYEQKLFGNRSGSGASRVVNTMVAIKTLYDYPLGTGLYFRDYALKINENLEGSQLAVYSIVDAEKVKSASSTNSYLRMFVQLGIPTGMFLTFCIFRQQLVRKFRGIFGLVLILVVSSAPILFYPFFMLFVVSGVLGFINRLHKF